MSAPSRRRAEPAPTTAPDANADAPIRRDIDGWEIDQRRRGRRDAKAQKAVLLAWVEACGWRDIRDAEPADVLRVLAERREAGLTGRTLNKQVSTLSTLLEYVRLVRPEACPVNWARGLPRCETDDATDGRRWLTPAEFAALCAWADQHAPGRGAFYTTLGLTGMRVGEARALTVDRVVLGDSPRIVLTRATKTRKGRVIPLHPELVPVLTRVLAMPRRAALVFPRGCRPTWRTLLADCKAAGIDPERVGFHSFRKFFASRLAAGGVPLGEAAKLLGHSTVTLTQRVYTEYEDGSLARAVAKISGAGATKSLDKARAIADALGATSMNTLPIHSAVPDGPAARGVIGVATSTLCGGAVGDCVDAQDETSADRRVTPAKPPVGHDPTTCALQKRCSTS